MCAILAAFIMPLKASVVSFLVRACGNPKATEIINRDNHAAEGDKNNKNDLDPTATIVAGHADEEETIRNKEDSLNIYAATEDGESENGDKLSMGRLACQNYPFEHQHVDFAECGATEKARLVSSGENPCGIIVPII